MQKRAGKNLQRKRRQQRLPKTDKIPTENMRICRLFACCSFFSVPIRLPSSLKMQHKKRDTN